MAKKKSTVNKKLKDGRNEKGQFVEGRSKGRPVGSENKLTRKAKYLLNKYYDALRNAGIEELVADSSAADKLRAILAGIPKDLNINHSGEIGNNDIDLSKLTDKELRELSRLRRKAAK